MFKLYGNHELKSGKCLACGKKKDDIVIEDGRCLDCIEDDIVAAQEEHDNFKRIGTQRSPFGF